MVKSLTPTERVVAVLTKKDTRLKFKELCVAAKVTHVQLNTAIKDIRLVRGDLMYGKFDKCYWFSNRPTWYSVYTDLSDEMPLEGSFGMISDTHLCSIAERLDLVNAAYDEFAKRGITKVFHTGDLTDGWNEYRGHINFVKIHGDQAQAQYAIKYYPKRPGIRTYVIGGN